MTQQPDAARRGSTHWSTRALGERFGIGKDTVARIWRDHEFRPWKVDRFEVSTDPRFEEKLVDVVGMYVDPPRGRWYSLSTRRRSARRSIARNRSLPMKPGRAGTMTHDYKRHGTVDLFAASNIATGEVITDFRKRHTAVDVLAFFKKIDRQVPRRYDVHVVLDNLSAHMAPDVTEWLAEPAQARWHLHFTPTSSSWLNLVERWFALLTDRRLRRGVFGSVRSSPRQSASGPSTGTTTRSPSSGSRPPTRSSRRSAADGPHSTRSNPRRVTRQFPRR